MVEPRGAGVPGDHPLALTGERTVPGVDRENYWFRRHQAAYRWVATTMSDRVRGATVVEAGSGEGYGAALLRGGGAHAVVALEYDAAAAAHSHIAYPSVGTVRANLAGLPLLPGTADLVVSMQVVEHLWNLPEFLHECARVLHPGGMLVASTPNRLTFSPGLGRGENPTNPFHHEEFDAQQLADLVGAAGFADVQVLGLHHAGALAADEAAHGPIVPAQVDALLADGWTDELLARVARVSLADFSIDDTDVDASLDLVVVAVRP